MSLNRVILMGRLTDTPECKQTPGGVSVCAFTLAVERNYRDRDGNRQTDFIDCVAWRQTAEFVARYFDKGMQAVVDGALQVRGYEDRQGNKRKAVEVVADQVYFAGSLRNSSPARDGSLRDGSPSRGGNGAPAQAGDFEDAALTDDGELPF